MAKRILAAVNPQALRWPREIRGMPIEVAADKAGIRVDQLRAYEDPKSGKRPTVAQLRSLARVYKQPTAFFYLDVLPEKPRAPHDYRLKPGVTGVPSHEILDAVIEARQRRLDALDLSERIGSQVPEFDVNVGTARPGPDVLAQGIRQALGISLGDQRTWRGDYYKALRAWSDAAEQAGILVCQFSRVDIDQGLGFSLPERPFPVVAINGRDKWPQRKIFTLMHELAHVVLNTPAVCDPFDVPLGRQDHDARLENYCNATASAILMPRDVLLNEPIVRRHTGAWSRQDLDELRRTFSVSLSSLMVRLVQLGVMAQENHDQFSAESQIREEKSSGFLSWPVRYVRDNGRKFTSLVMDAYASELVTSAEASRLLGNVKLKHFAEMRQHLQ